MVTLFTAAPNQTRHIYTIIWARDRASMHGVEGYSHCIYCCYMPSRPSVHDHIVIISSSPRENNTSFRASGRAEKPLDRLINNSPRTTFSR
jgi:hypothetical protein